MARGHVVTRLAAPLSQHPATYSSLPRLLCSSGFFSSRPWWVFPLTLVGQHRRSPTHFLARSGAQQALESFPVRFQIDGEVAPAHALNLQVHPYTYRNENKFLHFDFHQDPYQEYSYWIHNVSIDGLFTDFVGTLHLYQEWTSPLTFP